MVTDTQLCRQGTILVRIHSFLEYIGWVYYTEQQKGFTRKQKGIKATKKINNDSRDGARGGICRRNKKEHRCTHKKGREHSLTKAKIPNGHRTETRAKERERVFVLVVSIISQLTIIEL
jgi:hypothetical protein